MVEGDNFFLFFFPAPSRNYPSSLWRGARYPSSSRSKDPPFSLRTADDLPPLRTSAQTLPRCEKQGEGEEPSLRRQGFKGGERSPSTCRTPPGLRKWGHPSLSRPRLFFSRNDRDLENFLWVLPSTPFCFGVVSFFSRHSTSGHGVNLPSPPRLGV